MTFLSDKRGIYNEVFIVIVVFIALVSIVGVYWMVGTIGPIVVGQSTQLADAVQDSLNTNSPNSSIANASVIPIETTKSLLGLVESIVYLLFIGAFLGFLAVCYYVRTYKWLSMAWICLVIGAVIISMIVSNAYQQAAASSADLAGFYSTWGTNDFVLNYLPFIIGVLGVVGGIILFAIQSTGPEEETTEVN